MYFVTSAVIQTVNDDHEWAGHKIKSNGVQSLDGFNDELGELGVDSLVKYHGVTDGVPHALRCDLSQEVTESRSPATGDYHGVVNARFNDWA